MNPITRKKGLTIKQMGDEAVIFDTESGAVHHLNRVAEMVWRSCDGRTDKEALARMVERVCNVPEAGEAVDLALEQLSRRGLMTIPIERADAVRRMNRRVVLKGLAKAMAIPAVLTITARPGDVNGNGVINASDLNLVLGQFGARNGDAGWDSRCDLDANGRVDASDLSRVVRLQGQ